MTRASHQRPNINNKSYEASFCVLKQLKHNQTLISILSSILLVGKDFKNQLEQFQKREDVDIILQPVLPETEQLLYVFKKRIKAISTN